MAVLLVIFMEKVKNVTKSGWHPSGKDGKKESWRGDFKGINQVVCCFSLSDQRSLDASYSLHDYI